MEALTFLSPVDPINKTSKTYQKNTNGIEKISDYNLGYLFNYRTEQLPTDPAQVLNTVCDLLTRYSPTHFRIYGAPIENLVPPTPRKKKFFPSAAGGYRVHVLDIDGWPVSTDIIKVTGWELDNPETGSQVVRILLRNAGLSFLADVDLTILFSASQFDRSALHAHVYFQFEKHITLQEMRAVSLAANKGQKQRLFDQAMYRSVQPDFISPPVCDNFPDTLPTRILYSPSIYSLHSVMDADWLAFKKGVEQNTGQTIDTAVSAPSLGRTWVDTLRHHVGTPDMGINEPCYRAAAQLVNECGKAQVVVNMETYARKLYDSAWSLIRERGHRGSTKDVNTYDLNKFRSYIKSACDKNFGSETDENIKILDDAITAAVKGSPIAMFEQRTLIAAGLLKSRSMGNYILLRSRIKRELRGVLTLGDWEPSVASAGYEPLADLRTLLPSNTGNEKGDSSPLHKHTAIDLNGSKQNKAQAESKLMVQLMRDFDIIHDQEGVTHLGTETIKNGKKRYSLHPITNELSEYLYYKGTMLTDGNVGKDFGVRCMMLIRGALDGDDTMFNRTDAIVGDRVAQEGASPDDACWINLGESDTGTQQCLRVDANGVKRLDCVDSMVKWRSGFCHMPVQTEGEFNEMFGGDANALVDYYYNNIGRYIHTPEDVRAEVTAWCVTALTNRPMPYLAELIGPEQSGKSTAADFMKDLIDPDPGDIQESRERKKFTSANSDFFNLLYNQRVTILDNVSKLSADGQDSLCQVVTGMSFSERILYSHKQRTLFIKRPVIITGIDGVVTRADLTSRTLRIHFPETPKPDLSLYKDWKKEVPIFRRAIIEITHRVFKAHKKLTSSDLQSVKPRDVIYALVCKTINSNEHRTISAISQDLEISRAITSALADQWSMIFIAFLQSRKHIKSGDMLTTAAILQQLKTWAQQNFGMTIKVKLGKDRDTIYTTVPVMIDMMSLPMNTIQMGRFLSRAQNIINTVSCWSISASHHTGRVRARKFNENISLTSII